MNFNSSVGFYSMTSYRQLITIIYLYIYIYMYIYKKKVIISD